MLTARNVNMPVFLKIVALCAGMAPATNLSAQESAITWEVANRFSPFEAYQDVADGPDPEEVFTAWKFEPEEDHEQWHKRLWENREEYFGSSFFQSPYAGLITTASSNRKTALWDPVTDTHSSRIAGLARGAGAVQIVAKASFENQQCHWELEGQAKVTADCARFVFDFPIDGSKAQLTATPLEGENSVSTEIKVDHQLIVGIGESYSSGQGNPDIPARWKSWENSEAPDALDVSWLTEPKEFLQDGTAEAKWLDPECFRSFFNYQTLVALKVASENPHGFVSFLHYACSGAEVFDGLLNPQLIPKASNRGTDFGQSKSPTWFQARSQLNSLVMDLCENPGDLGEYPQVIRDDLVVQNTLRVRHSFQRHNSFVGELQPDETVSPSTQGDARNYDEHKRSSRWKAVFGEELPSDGLPKCPEGIVKPDLVLLGIGGNDAGFEPIVRYYVAPNSFKTGVLNFFASGEICPREGNLGSNSAAKRACKYKKFNRYNTEDLIDGNWSSKCAGKYCQPLANRLALSFAAVMETTGISAEQIVSPTYPDPFRSEDLPKVDLGEALPNYAGNRYTGKLPVLTLGPDGGSDKVHNPLGQWLGAAILIPGGSELAKHWRFDITRQEAEVIIREAEGIRAQQRSAAKSTGVSLVYATRDAFLASHWTKGINGSLPNATIEDRWDPATWEPFAYEESARAIRTFNDALLTQQDLDDHADFRGAAHPNLTGHRLMADRILPCVNAVLASEGNEVCSGQQ